MGVIYIYIYLNQCSYYDAVRLSYVRRFSRRYSGMKLIINYCGVLALPLITTNPG